MFTGILTVLEGLPIIGPIISNIKFALIALAILVVTNGITGLVMYVKGHNAAAAKCQMATIIRERDELKRDLGVQKSTGDYLQNEVNRLSDLQNTREQKDAENAVNIVPVPGCVVPDVPAPRLRGKRIGK